MTDTTKRDAVIERFMRHENDSLSWADMHAMADRIVELEAAVKAQEANRLAALDAAGLRAEFEHHGCDTLEWVADALTAARCERDRADRILAALRKPSAAMVTAVCIATDWQDFDAVYGIIHAAVAAAEQEVDRG